MSATDPVSHPRWKELREAGDLGDVRSPGDRTFSGLQMDFSAILPAPQPTATSADIDENEDGDVEGDADGASQVEGEGEVDTRSIEDTEPLRTSTSSSMVANTAAAVKMGKGKPGSPTLCRSPSGIHVGVAKAVVGDVQTGATPFPATRLLTSQGSQHNRSGSSEEQIDVAVKPKQKPRRSRLGDPSPAFMRTRQAGADVDTVYDGADSRQQQRVASQPVRVLSTDDKPENVAKLWQSVPPGAQKSGTDDLSLEASNLDDLSIAHSSAARHEVDESEETTVQFSPVVARADNHKASSAWPSEMAEGSRQTGWQSMFERGSTGSSIETPRKAHSVEVLSAPPTQTSPVKTAAAKTSTPLRAAVVREASAEQILPDDLAAEVEEVVTPAELVEQPDYNRQELSDEDEEDHLADLATTRPRTGYSEATATQLVDQTLGDVSFEASFRAPRPQNNNNNNNNNARNLRTLHEDEPDSSTVDSPLVTNRDHARPPPQRRVSGLSDNSDAMPLAPTVKLLSRTTGKVADNGGFDSPAPQTAPNGGKAWETPADTRRLVKEAPTKTAVTRRVQELKIPAAELDMIRSSVSELEANQLVKSTNGLPGTGVDKVLSVNESSQQIDVLQKENFELRLKIYFLEKQLGQETDMDKAALQRDNARLNVESTKLAQAAQMREKRTKGLEKRIDELEYEKMRLQRVIDDGEISDDVRRREVEHEDHVDELLERIDDQEQHIRELERACGKAKDELEIWIVRAEEAELRATAQSRTTVRTEDVEVAARAGDASMVDGRAAEKEVLALRREIEKLENDLAVRTDDLHAARLKISSLDEELASYEAELNQADDEREAALEELADKAELERREFELYIEERHIELDDVRERLREVEDSIASRIAEAIKPHEQAWRTVAADLGELESIIAEKEADWETERRLLEYQLDEVLEREKRLADQLESVNSDVRQHSAKAKTMEKERVEAERKLEQLAREYDDHIAATSEDLAREIKELKRQLSDAKSRVERGVEELAAAKTATEASQERRHELEVELGSVRENLKSLQEDRDAVERELPELRAELATQRQTVQELRAASESAEVERERLQRAVADQEQLYFELEGETRAKVDADLAKHDEAMATLQKELDEALRRASAAHDELRELHDAFIAGSDAETSMSADATLKQKLVKVLDDRDARLEALRKELTAADAGQESAVMSLSAKAKLADGLEVELNNLRARLDARDDDLDKLKRELQQREKQFASVNKAMRQQHDDHEKSQREAKLKEERLVAGFRHVCESLDRLFGGLPVEERPEGQSITKVLASTPASSVGASPQTSPVRASVARDQDVARLSKAASEAAAQIAQLGQRLKSRRGGGDAEARKTVLELQNAVSKRDRELTRARERVDELQKSLDDARQRILAESTTATTHGRNHSELRISLPPGRRDEFRRVSSNAGDDDKNNNRPPSALVVANEDRPHTDPTHFALARSSSRAGSAAAAAGVDSGALLARIELLSRELKLVREKAVEEKLAARSRLAASKKEVSRCKDLLVKHGVSIDSSTSSTTTTAGGGGNGQPGHTASTVASRANAASRTSSYTGSTSTTGGRERARSTSPAATRAPPVVKVRRQ